MRVESWELRTSQAHQTNLIIFSEFLILSHESSNLCENTRAYLDPQLKITTRLLLLSLDQSANKSKCAQWTDTTLVHKHEKQTINVKHKSKGREMQTQDNTMTC